MYASVRTGPRAELLAVVGVDDEPRAFVRASAQLLHRLAHVAERDEVAELHASGEDDHRKALVFSDVRLAELLRAEACLEEMVVVENGVRDAGLREERRQMRLPDALGEPRAERTLAEDGVHAIAERADLPDAVASRDADEDGLVVAPREELDLPAADEVREVADDIGSVRLEPIQQGAGEVEARFDLRMPVQGGNERGIRPLGHLLKH